MVDDAIVTMKDIPVMYVAGQGGKPVEEQAPLAFAELEARLPTLKGRKFYGAVIGEEYRACVTIDTEAALYPLPHPTWLIPGGKYARRKIRNWESKLSLIGQLFDEIRRRSDFDPSHPAWSITEARGNFFSWSQCCKDRPRLTG